MKILQFLNRFHLRRQSSNLELIQRIELKFLCLHLHNLKKRNDLLMEQYRKAKTAGAEILKKIQNGYALSYLPNFIQHSYKESEILGAITNNSQEMRETEVRIKTSVTNLRGK